MNKQTGNMYDFITHTWNPLGGRCPHNCGYCSTNRLRSRFDNLNAKYSGDPQIIEKEMKYLGSGKVIFVCAQNDLFADEVPEDIIFNILTHCNIYYGNKYFFQTKNPKRVLDFIYQIPENSIICTTIESNRTFPEITGDCPNPIDRAIALNELANHFKIMITVEPVLDFDIEELVAMLKISKPFQVNIGGDSQGNNLPEPSKEKLRELIMRIPTFTRINLKNNIKRLI